MEATEWVISRRGLLALIGATAGSAACPAWAASLDGIGPQPYFASVNRALEALRKLGAPVSAAHAQQLAALTRQGDVAAVESAESILARYTLARLSVSAEGAPTMSLGEAPRVLVEQGWRMFLLRIANSAGRTDAISVSRGIWSGTAGHMLPFDHFPRLAPRAPLLDTLNKAPLIEKLWLLLELYEATSAFRRGAEIPSITLLGSAVEYHVIQLFSRDAGRRRANLSFLMLPRAGLGGSARQEFDFECLPSRTVALGVLDTDGRGCVASLTIKDKSDHIYPPQAMRLAPDMTFQPHIYRADGETVRLPDGEYIVKSKRGPEYLRGIQTVRIDSQATRLDVKLQRWIDPARWGWYSGDTHIHAAGCAHYQVPTEGVSPETMIRHVRGEALSVGDVLTWGPSWYYQKQFFKGKAESPAATLEHPHLQAANNASLEPRPTAKDSESLLRYDVEVSGFPSSLCGHLVLLRLEEQDYPGTKVIEDWPSWNLPILRWAKSQGAVTGYAHCAAGMVTKSKELPNYEIPPFESIGTNEAIVDVTHDLVDFLSGGNGPPVAELNAWYHLLNCGFKPVMVGETDYPCISPPTDSRPGLGRSYVQLDERPTDDAGYQAWVRNLQKGRLYHGDGRTHFLKFTVNGRGSGDEMALPRAATVTVKATIAAWLEAEPTPDSIIEKNEVPWHIEHARIGTSREVPLELVVNGIAVERINFVADGTPRDVRFKTALQRSAWIALRILPSGHTHPVFIEVAGKPIRASRRSAQWCRQAVDKLWEVKSPHMRESERPDATRAFDHARRVYDTIADACEID